MERRKISEKERQKKNLQRIQRFCLMDDEFMTKVFDEDIECTELILRIILEKEDLHVKTIHTQHVIKNLQGRSARLDIHADDSKKRIYNIEIQRDDSGASPKRARFHGSIMDANALLEGDEWEKLPETYVIFITENDVLGENKPIYHIDRTIEETNEKFGDCLHIIYVNGAYRDDSPLGLLMQDFCCSDPDQMHYKELADRVKYFKEDKEGRKKMSRIGDEWRAEIREEVMEEVREEVMEEVREEVMEEVREEVREEVMEEAQEEMAIKLLQRGKMTWEEIAEDTELPLDEVKKLAQELDLMPV